MKQNFNCAGASARAAKAYPAVANDDLMIEIILSTRVSDFDVLWENAARLLEQFGTTGDDAAELIGTRDESDVGRCLETLLTRIGAKSGFGLEDLVVRRSAKMASDEVMCSRPEEQECTPIVGKCPWRHAV